MRPSKHLIRTGGQLLAREIEKCWENGVATDYGCFGPSNNLRKFADGMDDQIKNAVGENSEVYKAYKLYMDNVLLPGPNHDGVRAFNTALNDMQHGLGETNDIVRAGRELQKIIHVVTVSLPELTRVDVDLEIDLGFLGVVAATARRGSSMYPAIFGADNLHIGDRGLSLQQWRTRRRAGPVQLRHGRTRGKPKLAHGHPQCF